MPSWTKLPRKYSSLPQLCNDSIWATKCGDIGFYVRVSDDGDSYMFDHTVVIGRTNGTMIHSNKMLGVFTSSFNPQKKALFFRYNGDPLTAMGASDIAQNWSRGYRQPGVKNFEETTEQRVGFSDAPWKGYRLLAAQLGSCDFGSDARARLEKYQGRAQLAPTNVICSEMAILAYQLFVIEEDESKGFIKLDAKRTIPEELAVYLYKSPYWELVGRGG